MKKTLSLLIAVLMVMTIIAVPAMAATTEATFTNVYAAKIDLNSYEDGTVLTDDNVAATGVIKFAGIGTSTRDVIIDGKTISGVNFVNLVDISTQATEESASKVTVVEVEGEKVLKLESGVDYENAGIALAPVSGAALKAGTAPSDYAFDFYQPGQSSSVNALSIGFAKIGADGKLSYYAANELNGENPAKVNEANAKALNPSRISGVSPVFYYEAGISKLLTICRHNKTTGAFLGSGSFGDGTIAFTGLSSNADASDVNKIYDHWYSNSFKLKYLKDVGIQILSHSSYNVDNEVWSYRTCTIPLTAAEIAELDNVKIVPVISVNSFNNGGTRYMYLKDIRANVEGVYDKLTTTETKVIMSDGFESATIGSKNNTNYNSSYIKGYGIYTSRHTVTATSSSKQSVSVVANPSHRGNNSAKVLDIHGTARDSGTWAGFRSQAIPTTVFTSNVDGATFMYDVYIPGTNDYDFMNGRLYLHAANDAKGTYTCGNADSDKSDTNKIMAHSQTRMDKFGFTFNNPNGTGANVESAKTDLAKDNWIRVAFNLKAAADGTSIVKTRTCNLSTGEWTNWTTDYSFPLNLFTNKYLVWNEIYAFSRNGSSQDGNNHLYYDNFALVAGYVSPVAEIKGSGDNLVYPTDTFTLTFDAPVANESLLNEITLVNSNGDVAETEVSYIIADGKTVVTIDPVDDLYSDELYTVDFAGNKTVLGEDLVNVQFIVQEDWAEIETKPIAITDGDTKLVKDEILRVSMEHDGYPMDTYSFKVYTDSDTVTITENPYDCVYEIAPVKDGVANIYIQSLIHPGTGYEAYTVETIVPETAYTATYYLGGEVVYTEKVPANAIADGYTVDEDGFAGWSTTEDGMVEALAPVTADINYYAVIAGLIDIEFVSNNEEMGEIVDSVISVPEGGTLTEIPDYILADDQLYALAGWEVNGEKLTTAELLNKNFYEATTVTALFSQIKIKFGDEYDFTTMTAEEFGLSPFAMDTDFVLTEGTGIELVKPQQTEYYFNFLEDETPEGTYIIELDYIPADTESEFRGYDSHLYGREDALRKLHGYYVTAGAICDMCYTNAGAESSGAFQNLSPVKNQKHTLKYVIDFTTGKALTIQDGIAGIEAATSTANIAYADAGAPRLWRTVVKAGGSLLLTRFKFEKLDDTKIVKVTAVNDKNISKAGFVNNNNAVCTNVMYMLEGTKVGVSATVANNEYDIGTVTATSGTVEANGETYIYTAGAEDATITVTAKKGYTTATFDIGEGTLISGELTQTVVKGEAPIAPQVAAPEGKAFIGWSPVVGSITESTTYTAIYTEAETVNVTFKSENPDSAILDTTVKAVMGETLVAIPSYKALNGATFLYWEDEMGIQYTDEELAERVFDYDETIVAVFKQNHINNGVFDFTKHDISTFGGEVTGKYTINEDGSVHIEGSSGTTNAAFINGNLKDATEGIWVLTLDYKVNNGEAGSINGLAYRSSGSTQSMYILGDDIYVRTGNGSGAPGTEFKTFQQLGILTDGERHIVKAYYDLDNLKFRVSVDGHFAKIASYQLPEADISKIAYNFHNGFNGDVYAIGFEKLAEEDYPEFTASTGGYEYSSECKSWCYEGPVSLGDKVLYRAFDKEGYLFKGWYLNDSTTPVSTELAYTHTVTGSYKLVPRFVVKPKNRVGDVNLNGKVDVYDAVEVLKSVAGIVTLNEDATAVADVDGDGMISVTDATTILKYIARLISTL